MSESEDMGERVAKALEDASLGFSIQLTRLVDGVSTYELNYSDRIGSFEFSDMNEAHEHVAHRSAQILARAAIAAMREPTAEMRQAASAAATKVNPCRDDDHAAAVALDSQSIYRAMIDAALHSTEQKGTR